MDLRRSSGRLPARFPGHASTFDSLGNGSPKRLPCSGPRPTRVRPLAAEGCLDLPALVADLLAIIDHVSPTDPVAIVGHDFGAQLAYPAMTAHPLRFRAAILLAGAHPGLVTRNARRSPRQLWRSRYIVFFQLGRLADRAVSRDDFAYLDRLWRRWAAPGAELPVAHQAHVKQTFRASMPAPVAMYRAAGFNVPLAQVSVPTLYIAGAEDGCVSPQLADGQEALFPHSYRAQTWPGAGHFLHLEQPDRAAETVLDWLTTHYSTTRPEH